MTPPRRPQAYTVRNYKCDVYFFVGAIGAKGYRVLEVSAVTRAPCRRAARYNWCQRLPCARDLRCNEGPAPPDPIGANGYRELETFAWEQFMTNTSDRLCAILHMAMRVDARQVAQALTTPS